MVRLAANLLPLCGQNKARRLLPSKSRDSCRSHKSHPPSYSHSSHLCLKSVYLPSSPGRTSSVSRPLIVLLRSPRLPLSRTSQSHGHDATYPRLNAETPPRPQFSPRYLLPLGLPFLSYLFLFRFDLRVPEALTRHGLSSLVQYYFTTSLLYRFCPIIPRCLLCTSSNNATDFTYSPTKNQRLQYERYQ